MNILRSSPTSSSDATNLPMLLKAGPKAATRCVAVIVCQSIQGQSECAERCLIRCEFEFWYVFCHTPLRSVIIAPQLLQTYWHTRITVIPTPAIAQHLSRKLRSSDITRLCSAPGASLRCLFAFAAAQFHSRWKRR